MMKFTRVLMAFVCTLYGGLSYGASYSTGYFDIQTIRVGAGFLRVSSATEFPDTSNCSGDNTNTSRNVLVLEGTTSYKEILSFVLSAKMANRKVQFWVNGCEIDSGNGYPNGTYVYIQN